MHASRAAASSLRDVWQRQERDPEAVLHAAVLPKQDVLEHRKAREKAQVLETFGRSPRRQIP